MDPSDPSSSSSQPGDLPPSFLKNPKNRHISRSAAKRESVQLLGSIKDLQLHFARAGLVEHRPGAGAGVRALGGIGEGDEDGLGEENRAPGSELGKGKLRERRPWKDVEVGKIDIEEARKEVRGLVAQVGELWGVGTTSSPRSTDFPIGERANIDNVDVKDVLVKTAQAIRRVRILSLSLSHQSTRRVSTSSLHPIRPSKPRSSISTPSRPGDLRAVSYGITERKSSLGLRDSIGGEDDAGRLRKAALEVLVGLRGLEESLRIHSADDDSHIIQHHHIRAFSPSGEESTASSSMLDSDSTRPTSAASALYSEPDDLFEEDEYAVNLNALAQAEHEEGQIKETWEEKIISEKREYRALQQEGGRVDAIRESLRKWIAVVDALFGGVMAVQEVAPWAMDEEWEGKGPERIHAFLLAHLPLNLQLLLPPLSSGDIRISTLSRLSDGFILIQAFNAALTGSLKSWGFIPSEDIHDTLNAANANSGASSPLPVEDVKKENEWTFRRVGNLTCWAAAIRLRYGIPIHMPSNPSSLLKVSTVPAAPPKPSVHLDARAIFGSVRRMREVPKIDFDPMVVARRGNGWEEMLEEVLSRWIEAAAKEARGSSG